MIKINVGSTHYRFACQDNGFIPNTGYSVAEFIKKQLTQFTFNHRIKRWVIANRFAHMSDGYLYFLRYSLDLFLKDLDSHKIKYDIITAYSSRAQEVDIPLNPDWSPRDYQKEPIDFLMKKNLSMKALSAQTGQGKSFMSVYATSKIGYRPIIIVSGLLNQWKECYLEQTLVKEDEIYMIQGHKSFEPFMEAKFDNPYKVILASTSTLRNLITNGNKAPYKYYPDINILMGRLGIGTKVIDECHLNFSANSMIDLRTNIKHNIYLSATYTRSDRDGKRIFDMTFPDTIKYGGDNYERYVHIYAYRYSFGYINPRIVLTPQGYSQPKYEKYLLKRPSRLEAYIQNVIRPLVASHYINIMEPGQKMIIFCGKVEMCEYVADRIGSIHKHLNVATYVSSTEDEVLKDADIIVSTTGSLGTGNDIANLRTVLLTTSFSARGLCTQVLGRLRKLKDCTPEFVYIANTDISQHMTHFRNRKNIYEGLALKFFELDLY